MFSPYRKLPKFSLKRPRLSLRSCRCRKLASRSAMLSLSSAKAGSRLLRGWEGLGLFLELVGSPLGVVVCEARREVREGGRRGVVGRLGRLRVREWEEVRGRCGVVMWDMSRLAVGLKLIL